MIGTESVTVGPKGGLVLHEEDVPSEPERSAEVPARDWFGAAPDAPSAWKKGGEKVGMK